MTRYRQRLRHAVRQFLRRESGSITIHGLFTFVGCCMIGAIGPDVTHIYVARTQLQVAAVIAVHSAMYQMHQGRTPAQAWADATRAVQYGMPHSA